MTARSFWGVILSNERSEESKEPYGRQPDPQKRRVGNSLRALRSG